MAKDPTGQLYRAGALLFGLGALTGILVSASFSGKIGGSPQFMLAAHLNALMGCFWLFCVGVSWDRLSLKPAHARLLLRSTVLAAYANWVVTIAKSLLEVQGIDYVGEVSNDTIFGLLTLTVVIPTLLSSGLWVRGLWGSERG
jgi:hydroxylaminobenzene mutase